MGYYLRNNIPCDPSFKLSLSDFQLRWNFKMDGMWQKITKAFFDAHDNLNSLQYQRFSERREGIKR
jgi:hypothetical protein